MNLPLSFAGSRVLHAQGLLTPVNASSSETTESIRRRSTSKPIWAVGTTGVPWNSAWAVPFGSLSRGLAGGASDTIPSSLDNHTLISAIDSLSQKLHKRKKL